MLCSMHSAWEAAGGFDGHLALPMHVVLHEHSNW